jgi:fumarate reductase subunit D
MIGLWDVLVPVIFLIFAYVVPLGNFKKTQKNIDEKGFLNWIIKRCTGIQS